MHRMRILAVVFFFTGVLSVFAYMYVRKGQNVPTIPVIRISETPASPFVLSPPPRALTGMIRSLQGQVIKLSRDDSEFRDASPGASILLGESVATKPDSAAMVDLPGIGSVAMQENSEISFANMFPENSVLQQKSGKVFYTVESAHPLAIRVLHILISASSSAFLVGVDDTDISVSVQGGVLKIAQVDNNNDTHVWELEDGGHATIDDAARTVRFVLPR